MARYPYGGGSQDYAINPITVGSTPNVLATGSGTAVSFWTTGPSTSGGTQITDLQNATGGAITTITSNANGSMPRYFGPDNVKSMWAFAGGTLRFQVFCDTPSAYLSLGQTGVDISNYADLPTAVTALGTRGLVWLTQQEVDLSVQATVPDGVNLAGIGNNGNGSGTPGTKIKCTTSSAGLLFQGSGGRSGDVTVDGNSVATQPFQWTGSNAAERSFENLDVINSAQDGITVLAAQNGRWAGVNVQNCARDGIVMDQGAGGHLFERFEVNAYGRYGIRLDNQVSGGPYSVPTHNEFLHGLAERPNTGATSAFIQNAGDLNSLRTVILADTGAKLSDYILNLVGGVLLVDYGYIIGSVTASGGAKVANGTHLIIQGRWRLENLLNGFNLVSGGPFVQVIGDYDLASVTNRFDAAGTAYQGTFVRTRFNCGIQITPVAVADTAWSVNASTDAGIRAWMTATGILEAGPGTGFTGDSQFQRAASGVWTTAPSTGTGLGCLIVGSFTTVGRPAAATVGKGAQGFDTTLNIPIWSTGSAWVNAAGTAV